MTVSGRQMTPVRCATDLAVVVALGLLVSLGWEEVHGASLWWLPVVGGLVLGALLALLATVLRVPAIALVALAAVVFVLVGAPLALPASRIPGPEALGVLLDGAVHGWRDLVTLVPPVGARDGLLVPALLASMATGLVASSLALRLRRTWPALAVLGALLALVALLGTARAVAPLVQGITLCVTGLAWAAVRRHRAHASPAGRDARVTPRTVFGVASVLAVAVLAGVAAPSLAAPQRERFALREVVEPPVDPQAYPSPLGSFRRYVKDLPETPLFTVEGLPDGARLRLATLDTYDGVVWRVSGRNGPAGGGRFVHVEGSTGDVAAMPTTPVTVTIAGYSGVWLPTVGQTAQAQFAGVDAEALTDAFSYNAATGTGLSTRRLRAGDRYTLLAAVVPPPTEEQVARADAVAVALTPPGGVPTVVAERAGAFAGTTATAGAKAQGLASRLATTGYFSHGLDGQTSRAGHGADRVAALLADEMAMVGDAEQYAAAMALMARRLDLPARVVMGFRPDTAGGGKVTVTGDDVSAWVEVALAGYGWVVFDPVPDESRQPQEQPPTSRSEPRPRAEQPPPPLSEPEEPPPSSSEDEDEDTTVPEAGLSRWLSVAAWVLVPLILLITPVAVLLWLKRRRRRRRATQGSTSARIAGGWAELVDTARDLGTLTPHWATRREAARVLDRGCAAAGAVGLAERADLGVFAPDEPTELEVAQFWALVEAGLRGMNSSVPLVRRVRGRLSPVSLSRRR